MQTDSRDHLNVSRPPSPLPVVGIAKISPVPTYDQLHAGKTRPTVSDSVMNTKNEDKSTDEAPVKEQVFVDQIAEVDAQIASNKKSQKNKKVCFFANWPISNADYFTETVQGG